MSGSIFGKYQLLAQLGEGGMAQVFLAVHAGPRGSGFSKLTVIKKLRASYEEDPVFITMLVEEASLAARLNHPNVVQTHEVGDVDGKYFLSMEYLDGQSLHRTQNRSKTRQHASQLDATKPVTPFTKEMEYVVLLDVLAGLHHAHELADYDGTPFEIVHRDVTPHNVFITYEGQVKVVDFGIAKAAGRGTETRHGEIKGKMRYMAPEQAMCKALDRRADVFSVGVALWEAATGQRRWKDEPEAAIVRALISGEAYVSLLTIDPTISPEIDAMCKKALATDPEERFATAEEFRLELQRYLASTGKLVESRAHLGAAISDLFKDKRAELKAVIEKRLSTAASTADQAPMMLTLHGSGEGSSRRLAAFGFSSLAPTVDSSSVGQGTGTPSAHTPSVRAAARSNVPIAFGIVAAAALGVGALVFLRTPASSTSTTGISAPPPVAETIPRISVSITATPATAKITVDGKDVFAPYEAKLERSTTPHQVRIEAAGFEPQIKSVVFDRDLALSVALNKLVPPAITAAAVKASPPTMVGFAPRPATARTAQPTPSEPVTPPPSPTDAAPAPAAAAPTRAKKDIDRGNPFTQGGGPTKSIDKTSPFNK